MYKSSRFARPFEIQRDFSWVLHPFICFRRILSQNKDNHNLISLKNVHANSANDLTRDRTIVTFGVESGAHIGNTWPFKCSIFSLKWASYMCYSSSAFWMCVFIMSHTRLEWVYTLSLPEYQGTFARNRHDIWRFNDCKNSEPLSS